MVVGFGILFVLTFAAPKEFYETWFHVIFHFMVFLYVLVRWTSIAVTFRH
jgi:hypothetical protein